MNKPGLRLAALAGFMAILAASATLSAVQAKPSAPAKVTGEIWSTRCDPPKDKAAKYCEVFQRLSMTEKDKKEAMRVAEFAIGYPTDKKGARGVLILPLGILLDGPLQVQIGSGAAFTFHARFCDQGGCYSFLELGDDQIDQLKKNDKLTIQFAALNGQKMDIPMSLKGIGPALDKIKR